MPASHLRAYRVWLDTLFLYPDYTVGPGFAPGQHALCEPLAALVAFAHHRR
jgi:hypothetical protein